MFRKIINGCGVALSMFLFLAVGGVGNANALNYETELLLKLLEKKGIVTEEEVESLRQDMQSISGQTSDQKSTAAKAEEKDKTEKSDDRQADGKPYEVLDQILGGIEFSGAVEVEAGYEKYEPSEGESSDSSNIQLATMEFGVDAAITDLIKSHVLFYYEDDEDVTIDEAYISVNTDELCGPEDTEAPWCFALGKMYIPFGAFESHFISDPLTLELGETRETAAMAGLRNNWIGLAGGVFNGDINEVGEEDHIDKYFAAGSFNLPEDTVSGFGFRAGVSYISDISDSNGLTDYMSEEFTNETEPFNSEVESFIQGFSAFVSVTIIEKVMLEAEYLGTLDEFKENPNFEPQAWNLELAVAPIDDLTLAARYGGSDKAENFLPETQYGGCISYDIFDNTSLSVEYMLGEFKNEDKNHNVTAQIAVSY